MINLIINVSLLHSFEERDIPDSLQRIEYGVKNNGFSHSRILCQELILVCSDCIAPGYECMKHYIHSPKLYSWFGA
jgi:hypothetical protein